ncbi:PD-(D/E)XK motif protein [Thauera sp. CAU 1555]|uniref:PD-(D/E)XK motif protein n=1 Tax=Thauera sedimentorum TaxID=2767595 RepID=A0ABR9BAQ0_9RHOO|nr:PD-(D/E)XK motif protein [Thauera sedimentorum]MBC9072466.1 PD-(D/E)XK motif protein [Thauera sedimentorum]MBD8503385.1 PD-(D/E)XK motif protein [Thauera sedimentorum]
MNIWERFGTLAPAEDAAWPALRLYSAESHYLAKGTAGEPVFLLKVQRRRVPRVPLSLRHVQVEFEVDCAVRDPDDADGGTVSATFCRVVCDLAAPGLHPLFVNALAGAVEGLPPALSPAETDRFFDDAVELFRLFAAPARNSVLGLWGELFVIAASPFPDALVTGWHVSPEQTFDFVFPTVRLEVKTTARGSRQHEFALAQLRAPQLPVYVASLMVEQGDAGDSVFDLANAIQDGLSSPNRAKLWRLLAQSLGGEADGAAQVRFIQTSARNSLRFYDAAELPAPEIPAVAGGCISAVRFSLDIDRALPLQDVPPATVWLATASSIVR